MKIKPSHPIEESIGIKFYLTDTEGTGGSFRSKLDDFVVVESVNLKASSSGRHAVYKCLKRGIDTFEALELLSNALKVSMAKIGYAGLKDSRSKSIQYFTVYGLDNPPRLLEFEKAKFKLLGWSSKRLTSKLLLKNKFRVRVRNAKIGYQSIICNCTVQIEELGGLYNFYGHQRFGTRRPNTHRVGEYLLKKDWENAVVELVGKPSKYESREVVEARRVFEETLEPKLALEYFPERMRYERVVLSRLVEERDYLKALKALPKSLLKLYLEAYQSYLYNLILSKRVEVDVSPKEYIDGDFIRSSNGYRRGVGRGFLEGLEEVLIPLPGSGAKPPSGDSGRLYLEVLRSEGVGGGIFKVEELGLRLRGEAYRSTRMSIENLEWEGVSVDSYTLKFSLSRGCYATIILREIVKGDPSTY